MGIRGPQIFLIAGCALLIAGLGVAPIGFNSTSISLGALYPLGLVVIAMSGGAFLAALAMELRRAAGSERRPWMVRGGLFGLSLCSLYLFAEVAAGAVIVLGGEKPQFEDFRRRHGFENDALKIAHPFLILTNNPENEGVNDLGFVDREWPRRKPENTIRIACLGASTSEDGYPRMLDEKLSALFPETPIEVMNFGVASWTMAHSLINYSLNVKYFDPDYLIVHHGANELKARYYPGFRTDYSHAFTPLLAPERSPDDALVRYLNSYAYLKYRLFKAGKAQVGAGVYERIMKPSATWAPLRPDQLEPFRENLLDLIVLARSRQTEVILTTQPFSRTNLSWSGQWVEHMNQVNGILREVAETKQADLIDLDRMMGSDEAYFMDPVHLHRDAVALKVKNLTEGLLPILRRDRQAIDDSARDTSAHSDEQLNASN